MDKIEWAKWFIDTLGFAVIPIDRDTKKPTIPNWQQYSTRALTDEEKEKFPKMIEEGYNYGIPGQMLDKNRALVILDFEDKELLKAWIGESELNKLCQNTLCVTTPHNGLHIYAITEEFPEYKFNPAFLRENKNVMDLQSLKSYVVAPGSCINHKFCDSAKCPWKGQDYVTCYYADITPERAKINEIHLKGFLKYLVEKGKKLGITPASGLLEWLGGNKKSDTEEDFEKLKEEMRKYDRYRGKTLDAIRDELCKAIKKKIEHAEEKAKETLNIAKGVLCDKKTYADIGIDRSRGDWHLLNFLLSHGATDLDVVMQLLPEDSKVFEPKWDKYTFHTVAKIWERVKPWLTEFRNGDKKTELKLRGALIISNLLRKKYVIRTFYQD
ncbi:bifunctional DNA primase/polymerase, partial [Saccharolobus solfataricus]